MASIYVNETAAAKSLRVTIVTKGARHVATIRAHFGNSGMCLVNVHQDGEAAERSVRAAQKAGIKLSQSDGYFQHAKAGGYGYDKFTYALSEMVIDGHLMSDHCGKRLKLPKGMVCFPKDFKAPRGYSVANYGKFSKADGKSRHSYYWRDAAEEKLALNSTPRLTWTDAQWEEVSALADQMQQDWEEVSALADQMQQDWEESDDCVTGYADCYRKSGTDYLRALGYVVRDLL